MSGNAENVKRGDGRELLGKGKMKIDSIKMQLKNERSDYCPVAVMVSFASFMAQGLLKIVVTYRTSFYENKIIFSDS